MLALQGIRNIFDLLDNRLRRDAMRSIVLTLKFPPACSLAYRALHRARHGIGIENHFAIHVSSGAANDLHECGLRAEEALFVCIKDTDERYFWEVDTLSQEIHAHNNIELTSAKTGENLDALNSFNNQVNQKVTGVVTVKLYKGKATVVAMISPFAMHHASFTTTGGYHYNVNASAGFIEIYTLQMKLANAKKKS